MGRIRPNLYRLEPELEAGPGVKDRRELRHRPAGGGGSGASDRGERAAGVPAGHPGVLRPRTRISGNGRRGLEGVVDRQPGARFEPSSVSFLDPPEAAFRAADEMGFYLYVECQDLGEWRNGRW